MNGTIVVGVDGSETSAKAAEVAAALAVATRRVLHVISAGGEEDAVDVGVGSDRFVLTAYDRALAVAEQVAAGLRRPDLEITTGAGVGKPAEVLLEEAQRLGADVIVVGNRRMQGVGRILGSVASSVAHNAPCDVYIAKTT